MGFITSEFRRILSVSSFSTKNYDKSKKNRNPKTKSEGRILGATKQTKWSAKIHLTTYSTPQKKLASKPGVRVLTVRDM